MADASSAVKRTGVIGLGAMGLQMAKHMAVKGFAVAGYDVAAEHDAAHHLSHQGSPLSSVWRPLYHLPAPARTRAGRSRHRPAET